MGKDLIDPTEFHWNSNQAKVADLIKAYDSIKTLSMAYKSSSGMPDRDRYITGIVDTILKNFPRK